jgi:putative acetyltransferase
VVISCRHVGREDGEWLDAAQALLLEYGEFLGRGHICLGGLEHEIEILPGEYAGPSGALLLAQDDDGIAVGCVALRTITTIDGRTTGELKRMWVGNAFRALGAGQALLSSALDAAKDLGMKTLHLDTVPSMMPEAVKLYRRNGFVECPRYNGNLADYAQFFWRPL